MVGLQERQGLCPSPVIRLVEFLRFLFLNKMLGMVLQKLLANRADAPHLGQSVLSRYIQAPAGNIHGGLSEARCACFYNDQLEFTTEFPTFSYLSPFGNHKRSQC